MGFICRFGSYRISHSTGIVLNNHMDDFKTSDQPNYFGVHPSDVNKIEPGKRPQSSICPLVITDAAGDVRIVAGGSGGTRIISGLLNVCAMVVEPAWLSKQVPRGPECAVLSKLVG